MLIIKQRFNFQIQLSTVNQNILINLLVYDEYIYLKKN